MTGCVVPSCRHYLSSSSVDIIRPVSQQVDKALQPGRQLRELDFRNVDAVVYHG